MPVASTTMPQLQFLDYVLLGLRMLILPIIVGAVVFYIRNPTAGDLRERRAVVAGLAVAMIGAASVGLRATLPFTTTMELMKFMIDIFGTLCAGALVWICCHDGILLGSKQGGYWTKQGSRPSSAALACLVGTVLSLCFSVPLFLILEISLPPGYFPSAPQKWVAHLARMAAFSFAEEAGYRGWVLAALVPCSVRIRFRPWSANLLVAMLFAVQHTGGIYQMLTAFWSGLIMGVIFQRHGLLAAAATHLLLNLATLLFPLLP
jgi:membrane protease YdiL (CAAX protease family)